MNKVKIFTAIVILTNINVVNAQQRLTGFHTMIAEFTQKYAPDLKPLVKFHDWDEKMFLNDGKRYLEALPTYFHEQVHLFNDSLTSRSDKVVSRYYFFDGHAIEISKIDVYKTAVINSIVPNDIKNNIVRYKLYINGDSRQNNIPLNPDTQENGIYGLLEEFTAYYYSNLAYARIYDYMKDHYSYDRMEWFDYLGSRSNFVNTYYEFRLFIGYYFLFCKQQRPEMYKALSGNAALINLITETDKKFKLLVEDYWRVRDEIVKRSKNKILFRDNYLISQMTNDRYILPERQIKDLENAYTQEIASAMKPD